MVTAKVIQIKPAYLPLKECYKYVGMEADLFREVSREFGLSVYARGRKKILHKVSDLDKMMENLKIIDGNKKACVNRLS